jgi:hypothetical protein
MAIDKATLLAERFGVKEVEVEGVGTVRVRPLSRAEALSLTGGDVDEAEAEQKMVAAALVEPKLTADEVGIWQANSPAGELQAVVEVLMQISGLEKAAAKAAYQQF